jgi:hypothetical protein
MASSENSTNAGSSQENGSTPVKSPLPPAEANASAETTATDVAAPQNLAPVEEDSSQALAQSTPEAASEKSPQKSAPKKATAKTAASKAPMKSQKLNRTLKELESAFTDWESLSSGKVRQAAKEEATQKPKATAATEEEFRKKTKKLLDQLRQQLAELND